jgi:hypothetical protein
VTRQAACACGHEFEAKDDLAGGIANCPRCGRAVEVPGLRDPFWRVLQGLAALLCAVATAAAYFAWGLVGAVATAACVAALLWLVSRAL